jgi:DNA polymerase-3 subunit alpha
MNNSNFCHLHCHNEFSYLDGYGNAEQWVRRAKEMGFKYLALTNHGNVDGCLKFQKECEKQGEKSRGGT